MIVIEESVHKKHVHMAKKIKDLACELADYLADSEFHERSHKDRDDYDYEDEDEDEELEHRRGRRSRKMRMGGRYGY